MHERNSLKGVLNFTNHKIIFSEEFTRFLEVLNTPINSEELAVTNEISAHPGNKIVSGEHRRF